MVSQHMYQNVPILQCFPQNDNLRHQWIIWDQVNKMFKALELLLWYSVYLLCLVMFLTILFLLRPVKDPWYLPPLLPNYFLSVLRPPPLITKMIKFWKYHKVLIFSNGRGKKKLKVPYPASNKMKSEKYQMTIMIIFSQKQTGPPTCRSWILQRC